MVDKSFVCNASMPICQVTEGSASVGSAANTANSTGASPEQTSTSHAGVVASTYSDASVEKMSSTSTPQFETSRSDAARPSSHPHEQHPELPEAVLQSVLAAAQECLATGLSVFDIQDVVNSTLAHTPVTIKSPAEMSLQEAVEVALLAGVSHDRLLQELHDAGFSEGVARDSSSNSPPSSTESPSVLGPGPLTETVEINPHGPDRVVLRPRREAAPSTSSQHAHESDEQPAHESAEPDPRCQSLCSKQEVSDCEAIESELCASEEFYSTSHGRRSICSLDDGACRAGRPFDCNAETSNCTRLSSLRRMGVEAIDHFCKSLCFKYKVSSGNCSKLEEEDCKSRMYYMDVAGGKVLCQWEAAGFCSVDLSARCPQKQLCQSGTTSAPVPPFCYTLCDKIDAGSHVSACEELTEAKCKTWQYYATLNGHRALCSWSEIGVCSLAARMSQFQLVSICFNPF